MSEFAGTTADPVYKSMGIYPIGPCVLIDTAGFDDEGTLGELRVKKTREAVQKTDIALIVFSGDTVIDEEIEWVNEFKKRNILTIAVLNKSDVLTDTEAISKSIEDSIGIKPIIVSAKNKKGIDQIRAALMNSLPEDYDAKSIFFLRYKL